VNIWDYAIPAVTGAVAGLFSYFAGKRKSVAETDSVVIANAKEIISEWKSLKEERDLKNAELEAKIAKMEVRLEEMQLQIDQEKARYTKLHHEYTEAMTQLEKLKKRITTQEDK
jgi:peptidoglycan hydrolase CwlO-like protein